MSLIRYDFNNKLPQIQSETIVKKKVEAETLKSSYVAEVSGATGSSGVSESS